MKKIIALFIITLFTLQSCSVNSEITYHKDSASTTLVDVDMKDAMQMMKSMMPDSVKNDKKDLGELEKLPRTWTSFYDLEKKEGKLKTTNPDSIKIMKKIFMKSNIQDNEMTGISMKMEHFTKADYNSMGNLSKKDPIPVDQNVLNDWDGKTLVIDTKNFDLSSLKKMLDNKELAGIGSDDESSDESSEKAEGMLKMMFGKIGTTLKFETKIKSITGKHDWVTKVDDYSVRINYDMDAMFGKEKKLINADKKIVIVTE